LPNLLGKTRGQSGFLPTRAYPIPVGVGLLTRQREEGRAANYRWDDHGQTGVSRRCHKPAHLPEMTG